MRPTRMTLLLAQILGGAPLVACAPLDDRACLSVEVDAECPSEEEARDLFVGTETCESPVRKIVRTGELVSSEEIPAMDTGYYGPTDARLECCYEAAYRKMPGTSCVVGRPLVLDGAIAVAEAVPCAPWPSELEVAVARADRPELAAQWLQDALLEHASVAAFARLGRELVAVGAPRSLVARAGEALADEVRHARQCFELASAYSGAPVGPGPLPAWEARAPDLVRLAVESFEEGCVGETLAVCRAAVQLRSETDPAVRRVLAGIVLDEQRHAELAWDIVRWAIEAGGEPVRRAVAASARAIAVPAESPEVALALEAALDRVILPTAAELLAA